MERLSEAKLKTLSKDALIMLISGLWDQNDAIRAQLELSNEQLKAANKKLDTLSEQILLMNQRSFGSKSEKSNLIPGQMVIDGVLVFNEAEANSDDSPEPEIDEVVVPSYKRTKAKGQRDIDLSGIPARIIQHKLTKDELAELFPEGYKELPETIYKRLVVIPATFIVDEHHVHIYASKNNTGKIVRAKRPADVFRNSICTPELLSVILNSKYGAAVPLERMSASFKSNGIKLETNTLANWVIKSSEYYFSLIYDELHKYLLQNRVIHADETPLQVRRDGRKASAKSYMWVYRGAELRGTSPIVLYDWRMTRKADNPKEFLKGYCGTLVTDGYQVYHSIDNTWPNVTVAGCWIHARRDFAEFLKSANDDVAKNAVAKDAYDKISYIMHLDNQYDSLNKKDREYKRKHELKPIVDAFFSWAKEEYPKFDSESAIAKALKYCINQEKYLRVFLSDGNVPMDNNVAERAIRPFTIGRKNWVASDSVHGAKASAVIYSIVETAKANNLRVRDYLELILKELPSHMEDEDRSFLQDLLPWSQNVQLKCRIQKKTN